jgi:hypothetical protein
VEALGATLGSLCEAFGSFGCLLGSFWTPLGVSVTTFCVLRLNQGKRRICLEKRSPGAHGGDQDGIILGVLGPKICPKSTHGPPNVQKGKPRPRQAAAETQGGTQGAHKAPQSRKRRDLGTSAGGPRNPSNPWETPRSPPHSLSAEPPRRHPLPQSLRLLKILKETLRLLKV